MTVMLTLVFGLRSNLGKQFNKVWEVVAKELGADDEAFACVRREELSTEKLRLALYPKC
jgi:FPC/CPF motif-containing protein YcgG